MKIDLIQNVYGIKLIENVNFDNNCTLIYAGNGIMKTSFVKGISNIVNCRKPEELIFNNEVKYNLTIMGTKHTNNLKNYQENVLCFTNILEENKLFEINNIPSLLVNDALSNKLQELYKKQYSNLKPLLEHLKNIFNVKNEIDTYYFLGKAYEVNIDHPNKLLNFLSNIILNDNHFLGKKKNIEIWKLLLDEKTETALKESSELINYSEYLKEKKTTKYVDDIFSITELTNLKETFQKNVQNFFQKGNYIVLNKNDNNYQNVKSLKELEEIIKQEEEILFGTTEYKNKFKKLQTAFKKNKFTRNFVDLISNNIEYHWILEFLIKDINIFLRKYIESIIIESSIDLISETIKSSKFISLEINEIFNLSKKEYKKTKWKKVLDEFNERISLPFDLSIENKENSILNETVPTIVFHYFDQNNEIIKNNKDIAHLSSGEKKALFFLNLLYRINVLLEKKDNKGIVLILDDVVESFDYKNKYAILNYLFEFINDTSHYGENNKLIILSHNFDFIRTCQYHFRSGNETYLVKKDKNSKIIFNDFFLIQVLKIKKMML